MKIFKIGVKLFYLSMFVLINYNCNEKKKNTETISTYTESSSHDSTQNKERIDTSPYSKIKGFMDFDLNSTLENVESYLSDRKLNYIINPNFSQYFKPGYQPYGIDLIMDCPFAKFILVPKLNLEGFDFKNVVFSFQNNKLVNLTMNESQLTYSGGEFMALKEFYNKKYGTGEHYIDTSSSGFISETWWYINTIDSIKIMFDMYAEPQPNKVINKYLYNYDYSIDFKNTLSEKCTDYFLGKQKLKNKQKGDEEKKILDKL